LLNQNLSSGINRFKPKQVGLPTTEPNLNRWVLAARQGDVTAFGELYQLHFDRIYRYCSYHLSNSTEAEDLAAEVFLKAWQAIGRYRVEESIPFTAWLYRIAHNLVINHKKSFHTMYEAADASVDADYILNIFDDDPEDDPILNFLKKDRTTLLKKILAQLPEEQRQVLIFRFIEDWSHAQVAAFLGKNEGTIRGIQFRALASLAKLLEQEV